MKILLSIYSLGFYNRLRWMLKSIEELSLKVDTNVSLWQDDPYYQNHIESFNVNLNKYNKETFSQRHNCRNIDLQYAINNNYDYVCFLDSDLIFDKDFFSELFEHDININKLTNVPRDTIICSIDEMNNLVKEKEPDDICKFIKESYEIKNSGRCIGGGYFQMVSVQYCKENDISYNGRDRSVYNKKGQKAYSDKNFRKNFDGVRKIRNMKNRIYHLHHEKGNYLEIGER